MMQKRRRDGIESVQALESIVEKTTTFSEVQRLVAQRPVWLADDLL
jgi:hypothetical protein